jgi:hypothetical protein
LCDGEKLGLSYGENMTELVCLPRKVAFKCRVVLHYEARRLRLIVVVIVNVYVSGF